MDLSFQEKKMLGCQDIIKNRVSFFVGHPIDICLSAKCRLPKNIGFKTVIFRSTFFKPNSPIKAQLGLAVFHR